jgi:hypothetical protein
MRLKIAVADKAMNPNSQVRLWAAMIPLLALAGCASTGAGAGGSRSMFASADFTTALQYRKDALRAEQRGDSEDALLYMEKAQSLETRVSQIYATPPRTTFQLEHRAIAPAGGYSRTCNNTGINRFYCF